MSHKTTTPGIHALLVEQHNSLMAIINALRAEVGSLKKELNEVKVAQTKVWVPNPSANEHCTTHKRDSTTATLRVTT